MQKISLIDEVPCPAEVRILQKITLKPIKRGDVLNLPQFYRASFSLRAPTGTDGRWLTDQSERALYFCYVIITVILETSTSTSMYFFSRRLPLHLLALCNYLTHSSLEILHP